MKNLRYLPLAILLSILIYSCSKSGTTGPQGPSGANGTANLTTETFTITPSQWVTITAGQRYEAYLTTPAITDSINDLVEVSGNAAGLGTKWIILPVSDFINYGDAVEVKYGYEDMNIHYYYSSAPTVDVYIKVQVIAP